ncbi:hypothetical protein CH305_19525 [Rhodococcus sp. 15-649-2-2]|nr:hypothetical protein CH305_19525 [Rhodococcus sp. 15-649-2-2]
MIKFIRTIHGSFNEMYEMRWNVGDVSWVQKQWVAQEQCRRMYSLRLRVGRMCRWRMMTAP